MTLPNELLDEFLASSFPGLRWWAVTQRGGIFPSLRFELGGDIPNEDAEPRVAQAMNRASAIFEALFSPEDDGFISFTRWKSEDDPRYFAILPSGAEPSRTEGEDFYEAGYVDIPYVTYTAALRPRSIDYHSLFELIASEEIRPTTPGIDGRSYLVNTSTPAVFHMYDDRGAMVVANEEDALDILRTRFADWIIP